VGGQLTAAELPSFDSDPFIVQSYLEFITLFDSFEFFFYFPYKSPVHGLAVGVSS